MPFLNFQAQLGQDGHAIQPLRVEGGRGAIFRGAISKMKDGQEQTRGKFGWWAP